MKKLLCILVALVLLVSIAGCGEEATATRPDDWNVEAEVLRFCNGFNHAKTVEEMKPYFTSGTTDQEIQAALDENARANALYDNGDENAVNPMDYPYDSAEVTLIDTYKGYEILAVALKSQAYQEALGAMYGEAVMHSLYCLTIEDGHYVASMDPELNREIYSRYEYCNDCAGTGSMNQMVLACMMCGDTGKISEATCDDCGHLVYSGVAIGSFVPVATEPREEPAEDIQSADTPENADDDEIINIDIGMTSLDSTLLLKRCSACGSENITVTDKPCEACDSANQQAPESDQCSACNGTGWKKK